MRDKEAMEASADASLIFGIAGAILGLVPEAAYVAILCGAVGIVTGLVALSVRQSRGLGTVKAATGAFLGAVACAVSGIGLASEG